MIRRMSERQEKAAQRQLRRGMPSVTIDVEAPACDVFGKPMHQQRTDDYGQPEWERDEKGNVIIEQRPGPGGVMQGIAKPAMEPMLLKHLLAQAILGQKQGEDPQPPKFMAKQFGLSQ